MAELVAQSDDSVHRWRRQLHRHTPISLGRLHASWTVPWDSQISRRHATLVWDGTQLTVSRLPEARNPIFFQGADQDEITVKPGQYFVIGKTTFTLAQSAVGATMQMPDPAREQLFSKQVLNEVRFRDAEKRLAVLSDLPELIQGAVDDQELFVRLTNVVFGGVSQAVCAAVVQVQSGEKKMSQDGEADQTASKRDRTVKVLHWDRRFESTESFQPSQRLILSACDKQQSILHIWEDPKSMQALTMIDPSHDWAFVTPLPSASGSPMAIYVSGMLANNRQQVDSISSVATNLKEDIKFTELAANVAGSLISLRRLRDRQSSLRTFFSPVVLEALQNDDPETVLAPRQCEVSVLFCDLRGFSAASEQMAHDLMLLLNRVSKALGVTTKAILDCRGVVGDFHGDATMGFWGWPLPQVDQATRACRAALMIHSQFQQLAESSSNPLHGFQLGLGIASGQAVAGQIGTSDQVKVTAFGPVVNLAARLETMNRQLNTSILLDQRTQQKLQEEQRLLEDSSLAPSEIVTRRLGSVLPWGLAQPIEVYQLLPAISDYEGSEHQKNFRQAVEAFQQGDWEAAYRYLHEVPSGDRAKDFLTNLIIQNDRKAPADWDGVVRLTRK